MLSQLAGFGYGMGRAIKGARRWGIEAETPSKALADSYSVGPYEVRDYDNGGLSLFPDESLDHNGAFYQSGQYRGFDGRISQLQVNGKPLSSFDNVAILAGHGSPFSISGMSVRQIANMLADAIVRANKTRPPNRQIEYVVLDSCSQGNKRWLLFGETNAQALQRALAEALAAANYKLGNDVMVLASDRPGFTYGSEHKVGLTRRRVPVKYVPAAEQNPGIDLLDPNWLYVVAGASAVGLGAEGYPTESAAEGRINVERPMTTW
jgi:hypothetical protein